MKPSNFDRTRLRLVEHRNKYQLKYEGEIQSLFVDIPKCEARNGICKSQFSKDGQATMQLQLLFEKSNEEHTSFLEFMDAITALARNEVDPMQVCNMAKQSMYQESGVVMYLKLDTSNLGNGKVEVQTKLEGFPNGAKYNSTFMMSGTMKIKGLCSSPKGLAFIRRVSVIRNEGLPECKGLVIDTSSEELTFEAAEITKSVSLTANSCTPTQVDEVDEEDEVESDASSRAKRPRIDLSESERDRAPLPVM